MHLAASLVSHLFTLQAQHQVDDGQEAHTCAACSLSRLTWSVLWQDQPQPYDAIILAAPLEQSSLAFHGMPAPVIPPRTYKRVVTTVVASPALRPSYFGVQKLPGRSSCTFVLLQYTSKPKEAFSSASCVLLVCSCLLCGHEVPACAAPTCF